MYSRRHGTYIVLQGTFSCKILNFDAPFSPKGPPHKNYGKPVFFSGRNFSVFVDDHVVVKNLSFPTRTLLRLSNPNTMATKGQTTVTLFVHLQKRNLTFRFLARLLRVFLYLCFLYANGQFTLDHVPWRLDEFLPDWNGLPCGMDQNKKKQWKKNNKRKVMKGNTSLRMHVRYTMGRFLRKSNRRKSAVPCKEDNEVSVR